MSGPPPLPRDAGLPRPDYAAPRTPPSNVFDTRAFLRHLSGWVLATIVLMVPCLFILPRYEEILKDYKVEMPAATGLTLYAARLVRTFWFLLVPVALTHALAVGAWYPRAGIPARRAYRLLLTLGVCGLFALVIVSLFLPSVAITNMLSGVTSKK